MDPNDPNDQYFLQGGTEKREQDEQKEEYGPKRVLSAIDEDEDEEYKRGYDEGMREDVNFGTRPKLLSRAERVPVARKPKLSAAERVPVQKEMKRMLGQPQRVKKK